MTLMQMQYFQAVCKYENYTKAATALFVSQPAISKAIHEIEMECGAQLLTRKGNAIIVTDAGKILLEEIEVILSHVNNLQRLITTDTLNRNFIRIGLSTFSSGAVFP